MSIRFFSVNLKVVGKGGGVVTGAWEDTWKRNIENDVRAALEVSISKLVTPPHVLFVEVGNVAFVREADDNEPVTWRHGYPGSLKKEALANV